MEGRRNIFGRKAANAVGLSLAMLGWACLPAFALPDIAKSTVECELFSIPQRYNTQPDGDMIVIGAQRNQRYRVVVATQDTDTLAAIRACVLDAFITRSYLGTYINVGSFERRGDAETIRRILVRAGYPARTVYAR